MQTRQQMLDIIAAGGSVSLHGLGTITTAEQVPTQSALDAGTYTEYRADVAEQAILNSRVARPNTRHFSLISGNGATGWTALGEASNPLGTAAQVIPTAGAPWPRVNLASAAVLNNFASNSGTKSHWWGQKPRFQALYGPGATIAAARFYLGMTNAALFTTTLFGTDTPGASGLSGAVFRCSSTAADANWQCVTFNGASQTVVNSGVPATVSTPRKFEIYDDGAATTFSIDGAAVASITTTRPGAVWVRQGVGVMTLEAVAKEIQVGWLYVETDA